MTRGMPADTTENAVHKNIIAAGYGRTFTVSTWQGPGTLAKPTGFKVNYNSSTGNAIIRYALQDSRRVSMNVFDQQGRRIAVIVDNVITAGWREAFWDATRVPAGVYIVRVAIDGRNTWAGRIIAGK
jgi:hypothetical protein